MRGIVVGLAVFAALPAPAIAQDATGCDKFAWSIARERALFAADTTIVAVGDSLPVTPVAALKVTLKPDGAGSFVMAPERKPKTEHWFGGAFKLPALPRAAVYQVTLSDEAWIDIIQDGRYARAVGSTGRSDCAGVRKSVRLELTAAPLAVQLSGVAADSITLAIGQVE